MTEHSETLQMGTSAAGRMAAKRAIDLFASAIGLLALIPLFTFIAVAILIDDGGPVLYRQTRVGRSGRPFRIAKFRSMSAIRNDDVRSNLTAAGDPRVTRIGAFLRRTKLDELPQLFNVLVGDMSLVGPRPETSDLIAHYTPSQREVILSIRPGMTDYASLLLRDESTILARAPDPLHFYREHIMPLKYELCLRYLSQIGPTTDFRLVLATLWAVVFPSAPKPLIGKALLDRLECVGAAGVNDAA